MSDETDIGNAIEEAANAVFGDGDTRGGPGHGRCRRLRLELLAPSNRSVRPSDLSSNTCTTRRTIHRSGPGPIRRAGLTDFGGELARHRGILLAVARPSP